MGEKMKDGRVGNLPKKRQGCLQADLHLSLLHIEDVPENEKKTFSICTIVRDVQCTIYMYMFEET